LALFHCRLGSSSTISGQRLPQIHALFERAFFVPTDISFRLTVIDHFSLNRSLAHFSSSYVWSEQRTDQNRKTELSRFRHAGRKWLTAVQIFHASCLQLSRNGSDFLLVSQTSGVVREYFLPWK
jgi:hypothetical protein